MVIDALESCVLSSQTNVMWISERMQCVETYSWAIPYTGFNVIPHYHKYWIIIRKKLYGLRAVCWFCVLNDVCLGSYFCLSVVGYIQRCGHLPLGSDWDCAGCECMCI